LNSNNLCIPVLSYWTIYVKNHH